MPKLRRGRQYLRLPTATGVHVWLRADRAAWLLMTGSCLPGPVPKLDRDETNLRWANLCTRGVSTPKSGARGVYLIPGIKRDTYRVTLHVPKGKFSTHSAAREMYVGCWPTLETAHAAFLEGKEMLARYLAHPQLDGSHDSFMLIRRAIRDTLENTYAKQ